MNMGRPWSADELRILIDIYAEFSTPEVAALVGHSVHATACKAGELGLRKSRRYLATVPRGGGGDPVKRQNFIALCDAMLARPEGARRKELADSTGFDPTRASDYLSCAVAAGELFSAGPTRYRHYFKTAEQRDAGSSIAAEILAAQKAAVKKADIVAQSKKRSAEAARVKSSKPPRVRKKAVAKLGRDMLAPSFGKRHEAKKVQREVIIPDHVKVQRIPGIERMHQPATLQGLGAFSSAGVGRYPFDTGRYFG